MRSAIHHTILSSAAVLALLLGHIGCNLASGRGVSGYGYRSAALQREIEKNIRNLSAKSRPSESLASWAALKAAGVDAFPRLVAHLEDRAVAADAFQRATKDPTTVGEACFDLLQTQIEGAWPGSVREFQVLSRDNAGTWLDAHRGLTLVEMRQVASRAAVERAVAALNKQPTNDHLRYSVQYLKERNSLVERGY